MELAREPCGKGQNWRKGLFGMDQDLDVLVLVVDELKEALVHDILEANAAGDEGVGLDGALCHKAGKALEVLDGVEAADLAVAGIEVGLLLL